MHGTSEWAQPSGRAITVTLWPRTGVPLVRDQRPYQSRSLEPRSQPLRKRPQTDTRSRSLLESFFGFLRPRGSFRTLRSLQSSRCFRSLGPVSPNGAFHTDRSFRLVTLHRLRGPLLQVPRHTDRRFRLVGRPAETEGSAQAGKEARPLRVGRSSAGPRGRVTLRFTRPFFADQIAYLHVVLGGDLAEVLARSPRSHDLGQGVSEG